MKTNAIMVAATLMAAVPLVAANDNGFENFVLSRGDYRSNPSASIADFSSRTYTEDGRDLAYFSSRKPLGTIVTIR